jgi:hypothetical protein
MNAHISPATSVYLEEKASLRLEKRAPLTGKHASIFGNKSTKRNLTGKTAANFGHSGLFGQYP